MLKYGSTPYYQGAPAQIRCQVPAQGGDACISAYRAYLHVKVWRCLRPRRHTVRVWRCLRPRGHTVRVWRCLRPRRHTGVSWEYCHTDAVRDSRKRQGVCRGFRHTDVASRSQKRQGVWRNGVCKTLAHTRLFTTRQRYIFSEHGEGGCLSSVSSIRPCRRHEIPITPHQATAGSAVWGCARCARLRVGDTPLYPPGPGCVGAYVRAWRCLRPRRHTGESWKYRPTDAVRGSRKRQGVWRGFRPTDAVRGSRKRQGVWRGFRHTDVVRRGRKRQGVWRNGGVAGRRSAGLGSEGVARQVSHAGGVRARFRHTDAVHRGRGRQGVCRGFRHTDVAFRGQKRQGVWRNGVCKTLVHTRLFTTMQRYIFSAYRKLRCGRNRAFLRNTASNINNSQKQL